MYQFLLLLPMMNGRQWSILICASWSSNSDQQKSFSFNLPPVGHTTQSDHLRLITNLLVAQCLIHLGPKDHKDPLRRSRDELQQFSTLEARLNGNIGWTIYWNNTIDLEDRSFVRVMDSGNSIYQLNSSYLAACRFRYSNFDHIGPVKPQKWIVAANSFGL